MIIYKLTNKINGKIYIGLTTRTLEQRLNQHHYDCRHGVDRPLYRAMRKYGEDAFASEIIDTAQSLEELKEKEQYWIKYYDSYGSHGKGYNATWGGDTSTRNSVGYTQISLIDGHIIQSFESAEECNKTLKPCTTQRADKVVTTTQYLDYVVVKTSNIESLTQEEIKDYAFSLRPKIICQLDKEGNLIRRWINSSDILKVHPEYTKSCIFNCLWGTRKTHKRY
ncbi:MAG: GIY-YIG nuclease family protein [Clostridia bacterium]|nr:GIY-YIG nuclease family protein [Clostridia bacterium]